MSLHTLRDILLLRPLSWRSRVAFIAMIVGFILDQLARALR